MRLLAYREGDTETMAQVAPDGDVRPLTPLDRFCAVPALPTVFGRWAATLVRDGEWIPVPRHEPGLDVRLTCSVNEEVVQSSVASRMIFSPAALIPYTSRTTTLLPGDLICTGTPEGVGLARQPRSLAPGDLLATEIEGLGRMVDPVVGASFGEAPPLH